MTSVHPSHHCPTSPTPGKPLARSPPPPGLSVPSGEPWARALQAGCSSPGLSACLAGEDSPGLQPRGMDGVVQVDRYRAYRAPTSPCFLGFHLERSPGRSEAACLCHTDVLVFFFYWSSFSVCLPCPCGDGDVPVVPPQPHAGTAQEKRKAGVPGGPCVDSFL